MALIHYALVQVAHQRTKRRRIVQTHVWARYTPDLTPYPESEPVRPELGAVLTEYRVPGRDALGAVWADLSEALDTRVVACVAALAFLWAAGRGL